MCSGHVELAHSPETEVADMLRTVGDHVNEEFGEILSEAVAAILPPQAVGGDIPYATLRSVAESLIEHVHPGWSQVLIALCIFLNRLHFKHVLTYMPCFVAHNSAVTFLYTVFFVVW